MFKNAEKRRYNNVLRGLGFVQGCSEGTAIRILNDEEKMKNFVTLCLCVLKIKL